MKARTSLVALVCLLALGGAQAENLIINGDFQSNTAPQGGWDYAANDIWGNAGVQAAGWTFGFNTGTGIINEDWSGWAWQGMATHSAVAFLQDHAAFGGAAPLLSQTFASNAVGFQVSFDVGQRQWNAPGDNAQDVIVMLDGAVLGGGAYVAPDDGGAHRVVFDVQGLSGNQHTLTFTSAFAPGDQTAFIDNVSVVATAFAAAPVPEPSTYALMGLGLVAVGALRRRAARG